MENGQKAECTVNCTWSADAPSQEPAGTEPAANGADAPAETKPTLSANDITLDSEGDTQQITVTGASGEVTWTSSDTKIATVTADGTITAVAPGRATVTAKVGDQTLNCAVCKSIVEHMNGRIEVISAVDEGSTFTVTFPCQVQPAT